MHSSIRSGVALLLTTALLWGATFPIAKPAVMAIDVFWLGAIRYAFLPIAFGLILLAVEGRASLRYEGRFGHAALVGIIGFVGYNLFAFAGLQRTSPEHTALIASLQSVLVALALWVTLRKRPAGYTLGAIALASVGLLLVVTRGNPASLGGGKLLGDVLALIGTLAWLVYILGVPQFPGWSALRYTTLTVIPGAIGLIVAALTATALGYAQPPSMALLADHWFAVSYLTIATALLGVLAWNAGIARLGPLNASLFATLIPVVTFVIRSIQGEQYVAAELTGAALVIAALVGNNLYLRRATR